MKTYGILLSLTLLISPAYADWKDMLGNVWGSTEDIRDKTAEKTKEYSESAFQKSKDYYQSFSNSEAKLISKESADQESTQHLKKVWSNVLENLDDALVLNTEIDEAPASRWFGADKESLGEDQVDVFTEIEELLANPGITANRKHIDQLKKRINKERQKIAVLKEKKVVASSSEKAKLDRKIQKSVDKIATYNHNIDLEKDNLKVRLQEMGLLLNNDQVDVLLSRVDSDDIIKMSVVYDVLSDITSQLMELTQEFNEDINQARKYYGMHVVLLKFVMNMQQSYIKKLDEEYLPKINDIRKDTAQLTQESKKLLQSESKPIRRNLLSKNLQAQALTLKVANIYAKQLSKQKAKVHEALELVKDDYRVAKNTYDTVKLSSDLIRLMRTNQASFNALMNIQIPDIVPFENIEMQKKFEELSILLKH